MDEVRMSLGEVRKLLTINMKTLNDHLETIINIDKKVTDLEERLVALENK